MTTMTHALPTYILGQTSWKCFVGQLQKPLSSVNRSLSCWSDTSKLDMSNRLEADVFTCWLCLFFMSEAKQWIRREGMNVADRYRLTRLMERSATLNSALLSVGQIKPTDRAGAPVWAALGQWSPPWWERKEEKIALEYHNNNKCYYIFTLFSLV